MKILNICTWSCFIIIHILDFNFYLAKNYQNHEIEFSLKEMQRESRGKLIEFKEIMNESDLWGNQSNH